MADDEINPAPPLLVGVGQTTVHWGGLSGAGAPNPQSLQIEAAKRALADSGASDDLAALINAVMVIRANLDSVRGAKHPFGRCANPPDTLAAGAIFGRLMRTKDFKEGVTAFAEKRKPVWSGS